VLHSDPLAPAHSAAHLFEAHELIAKSRPATVGEAAVAQAHLQAAPELLALQVPSQVSVVAQVAEPLGMPPPPGQSVEATAWK
jgi:hypothetical protein